MTIEHVRACLEGYVGRPLPSERALYVAYAEYTGFTGRMLVEEFNIAIGRWKAGVPTVLPDGTIEEADDLDPVTW